MGLIRLSLDCSADVRHPRRQAQRRPRPASEPRKARRRGDFALDARDPSGAARGRRQLPCRQGLRGARQGARARAGRRPQPHSRPAGREDRPRGADGADGHRGLQARVREQGADRDPARRPSGLGQDDRRGQAGAAAPQGGPRAGARRRRPPASGRRRAAAAARPPDPDSRLHRGRSRSRPQRWGSSRRARRVGTS